MKKFFRNLAIASIGCIIPLSCSTTVIESQPDFDPDTTVRPGKDEVKLRFRIMTNSYTRANANEIESIYLVFYHADGTELKQLAAKDAISADESGDYFALLSLSDELPNMVVAYANISDEKILLKALEDKTATIDNLSFDSGNSIVMTSARYYDTEHNNADIYYSSITSDHLTGDVPIPIYLERVAAKVTVSAANTTLLTECTDGNYNSRQLALVITGWDITGSDKSSFLLKNNGGLTFSQMQDELGMSLTGSWTWNSASDHSLKWAHSVNWSKQASDFPASGEESETALTRQVRFSDIGNVLNEAALVHETTRPASLFNTPNARPAVILAGYYTLDNNRQTLYRQGNHVLSEQELIEYFAAVNKAEKLIYFSVGGGCQPYGVEEINLYMTGVPKPYLVLTQPEGSTSSRQNMVTLQINIENVGSKGVFLDKNGTTIPQSQLEEVNRQLAQAFGLWEVYKDGNCFFHIPIEHTGKSYDPDNTKTGSYGIVRNHHYKLTVKEISGFGHGVHDENTYVGEMPYQSIDNTDEKINYAVSVNAWNDIDQDVTITK